MKMTADLSYTEESLHRLCIAYRELPCKNGWFYYCKSSVNGISFDIKIDDDGTIRLWRFVGTAPISSAGKCCEYCCPEYPHAIVGVEVTDEGDLCFYVELKIDLSDSDREDCITHIIENYVSMISDMCLKIV